MGAELSSCCGGSDLGENQVEIPFTPEDATRTLRQDETKKKEEFRKKLDDGINVNLILQDRTKLMCSVAYDSNSDALMLSAEKKVRSIPLKDIKAILKTRDQLKRVESSAGIEDYDLCAALHLTGSGNCIPLFFLSQEDKALFVSVLEDIGKP